MNAFNSVTLTFVSCLAPRRVEEVSVSQKAGVIVKAELPCSGEREQDRAPSSLHLGFLPCPSYLSFFLFSVLTSLGDSALEVKGGQWQQEGSGEEIGESAE